MLFLHAVFFTTFCGKTLVINIRHMAHLTLRVKTMRFKRDCELVKLSNIAAMGPYGSKKAVDEAKESRDAYKEYLYNEEAVEWQKRFF